MYSSILLPIDLEHESSWTKALPVAKTLAAAYGAGIHVLTVVADIRGSMSAEFFPTDFEDKLVDRAKARLDVFIAENLADQTSVGGHVEAGAPYRAITATAEKLGCDLIVMASHKPELLDLLIGPNADYVVRHTKCSVLVVRD